MKKIFIVLTAVMMILGILSCGSSGGGVDAVESCSEVGPCIIYKNGAITTGATVKVCCTAYQTSTQCRYLVDGKSFECNGTDCYAAMNQAIAYCSGNAADLEEMLKSVQQAIIAEGCTDNRQIDE